MILLDGKSLFKKIKKELKQEVKELIDNNKLLPHLVALLVGDNAASQTYVNAKVKACDEIGFKSTVLYFDKTIKENELINEIHKLNNLNDVHGVIVQLPLPVHINESKITHTIDYKKDVDGFHPINIGRMVLGLPSFLPATPFGIISLLDEYNIETTGKNCLVIGRSHIVGTPMSILLSRNIKRGNATVTLAHSQTSNLEELCKKSDIIVVAIGVPHFIQSHMLKKDVVLIDVGIHRIPSDKTKSGFRLIGDVDFDNVKEETSFITPVPGGVGPMTIASLLRNTLYSAKKLIYSHS